IAAFGIVIGLVVPMCNIASVWALARHHEAGFWAELVKNPLILATVGGVVFSLLGIALPDVAHLTIARMGSASLACGLLCVGAALTLTNAGHDAGLISAFTAIKLVLMPALALALINLLLIGGLYREMVMLLAALPTATSAYVLAVRMGGDGPLVAQCVTISTLCGMITLPLWMMLAR
ncbi:MAG TPA: AEC family transporter, partial [Usitatibacteraceae bacterium]|nr:AEC family transporter [Usitatibacteraceae bacterium]